MIALRRCRARRRLGFAVETGLGFTHQIESDGQGQVVGTVKRGQGVDAFKVALLAVIVVTADEIILIGVRLFFDAVIKDGIIALDFWRYAEWAKMLEKMKPSILLKLRCARPDFEQK
ncbi:MAG: hypothetical protein ACJ74J_11660 [Blastocatellia bacterium]